MTERDLGDPKPSGQHSFRGRLRMGFHNFMMSLGETPDAFTPTLKQAGFALGVGAITLLAAAATPEASRSLVVQAGAALGIGCLVLSFTYNRIYNYYSHRRLC